MSKWEAVIGLEIHIQLNTQSKAFSPESNQLATEPNQYTHPVSLAMPGTLPRTNQAQIESAVKLSLALNAHINQKSSWDRKTYFYADMPKAYQITQQNNPISSGGVIDYFINGKWETLAVHHLHMEEDAGKSTHDPSGVTLIDFNRTGTPLIELVTEPEIHSADDVYHVIESVQRLVRYLGISEADMEKGHMRADCNVSIRKKGSKDLNTRCEIKNVNSKRFAKLAVSAEIDRQINLIEAGQKIVQQTLQFDTIKLKTEAIREKEDAQDYRYFPDPDLGPVILSDKYIALLKDSLNNLPKSVFEELETYGLHMEMIIPISDTPGNYAIWTQYKNSSTDKKSIAELIVNKIIPSLKESGKQILDVFSIKKMQELLSIVNEGHVTKANAFQILYPEILNNPQANLKSLAEQLQILIVTDDSFMLSVIEEVLASAPNEVKAFQEGKKQLIGFFMGQVARKGKGKLDPQKAKQKLEELLMTH